MNLVLVDLHQQALHAHLVLLESIVIKVLVNHALLEPTLMFLDHVNVTPVLQELWSTRDKTDVPSAQREVLGKEMELAKSVLQAFIHQPMEPLDVIRVVVETKPMPIMMDVINVYQDIIQLRMEFVNNVLPTHILQDPVPVNVLHADLEPKSMQSLQLLNA